MKRGMMLVGALLALGCARGPNISTEQLPLKRVVVYRNGVGYFERSGHVDADRVTFEMRQRMVGDFLATLAIVERGGSSVRSASFPLELDDDEPSSPPGDPRFQSMLKPWPEPPPEEKDPGERMRKVILDLDGEEHDLAIGYVSETPVWRPSYRLVIREDGHADLQAWGIVQNLSGEDWNQVQLALVAGAPLAFESTLGDPVIPTRPIVTDTGEVIASVPTGVTTLEGKDAEKVDRYGGEDDEDVPKAEPAEEAEAGYAGDEWAAPAGRAGGGGKGKKKIAANTGAMPPPSPKPSPARDMSVSRADRRRMALEEAKREGLSAPRKMSALAAVAIEAGTTRYEIPTPITVPDESATMVLLINKRVPGQAVFLYAPDPGVPDSSSHPFRVARFTNATKGLLERGPIAVFEQGSFLGQGVVTQLPPKAKATVPFALERSLAVQRQQKYDRQGARLHKIEAGEIWVERDQVTKTIYEIKNGSDKQAKMLVKHPRQHGTRLYKPPQGTEDNVGQGHALIPLEVRPHGKSELTVDERRESQQQVDWLSQLADEAVEAYLRDDRGKASIKSKLKEAWRLREQWKKAAEKQAKLVDEQRELEKMTRETRLSLQAIEKNAQAADLRRKLTLRLNEGTTRLEQITKELIEVKMAINEQRVRFLDAVREIKLLNPPPPKD